QAIGPVTLTTNAPPGTQVCFVIGNHSANWRQCCFVEVCVTLPCCELPADLNCDGVVNAADLGILLGGWGSGPIGDLNGYGVVNAVDLGILLGSWGQSC